MRRNFEKNQSETDKLLLKYAADAIIREEVDKFDLAYQKYSHIPFPSALRENADLLIERWQKKNKKIVFYQALKNVSKAVATVVLAVVLSTAVLCTVSEAVRTQVLNIIYTVFDQYDELDPNYSEDVVLPEYDPDGKFMLQPAYIPEGYVLVKEDTWSLKYQNPDYEFDYIRIDLITDVLSSKVNNENINVEKIVCDGKEIELRNMDSSYIAVWRDRKIVFVVYAPLIDKQNLLDFISNLYWLEDER
jgi:hypothetical protein